MACLTTVEQEVGLVPFEVECTEFGLPPCRFDLPLSYIPECVLGCGSFGVVIGVNKKRQRLAVKKVHEAFADVLDGARLFREIKIMSHLDHPNLLALDNLFTSGREGQDVYIVSPRMHTNLRRTIELDLNQLTLQHIKFIVFQILQGLQYLHKCGLVHR